MAKGPEDLDEDGTGYDILMLINGSTAHNIDGV